MLASACASRHDLADRVPHNGLPCKALDGWPGAGTSERG
jgi:hypothetical protein